MQRAGDSALVIVDVENGCYALDYRLAVGWGTRSGKCVSNVPQCLGRCAQGAFIGRTSSRVRVWVPGCAAVDMGPVRWGSRSSPNQ